jgi:hypothetical protein
MGKWLRGELGLGFGLASILWIIILGWQAAYAPTEFEKEECQKAAYASGHKSEDCKTLWEKTTSDPVAFFTFWLSIFTAVLGGSTIALWLAGERQLQLIEGNAEQQSQDMREANAIARNAIIANRRAWIVIDDALLIGPNTHFKNDGIWLHHLVMVRNIGNAPALNVDIRVDYCRRGQEEPDPFRETYEEFQRRLRRQSRELGEMLFPGVPHTLNQLQSAAGPINIKKALSKNAAGQEQVQLLIFVGVTYRLSPNGDPRVTVIPYELMNVPVGTQIADGQTWRLRKMPFTSGFAD